MFRPIRRVAKKSLLASSRPSVRPSVRLSASINATTTPQIYVKFNVCDFKKICGENSNLANLRENIRNLHEEKSRFYWCCDLRSS